MSKREMKTPEYTRRAIAKYNERFDIFSVKLPAGTKERMLKIGFTPSDRVAAIMAAIEKREKEMGVMP
jgi:hypothetical protein